MLEMLLEMLKIKLIFSTVDKQGGDGNAVVTIKGATQDAQDAKKQVLDLVGSRSYENRGSHRSDGNRGSNNFDSNRGSNRSDGYHGSNQGHRDYDSRQNTRNHYGEAPKANDRVDAVPQQNNDTAEPMEYEMIDWQAAARESVCFLQNVSTLTSAQQ